MYRKDIEERRQGRQERESVAAVEKKKTRRGSNGERNPKLTHTHTETSHKN